MRTARCAMILGLTLLMFQLPGTAMVLRPDIPGITLDGRLNCPYVSTCGGTAYLQISLHTPEGGRTVHRSMNVAAVIDRSGSMGDERKIEYARQAVLRLIDQLAPGDIFSLVMYDDVVEVPWPAQPVGNKAALRELVNGIYPRGATNLGGGMVEGFRQVERHLDREYVNRVILLSDGLANRGTTDPWALSRIAGRYRQRSISLTTMGVGLEYNENLMMDLSQSGGGNYYFIESPGSLVSIMAQELNTLSCVLVQNACIELKLGGGVAVADVIGCEHYVDGNAVTIPLGDLRSQECREVTVELSIPPGRGDLKAVTGELRYDSERMRLFPVPAFAVYVHYTDDAAMMEKNKDWEVQSRADVALSTRQVEQAMHMLDEGRKDEAERTLNEAQHSLAASPAAAKSEGSAEIIRNQVARIDGYARTLGDKTNDLRRTKKAVQFDNYQTQRKK